jgi:hypothetical protein
MVTDPRQIRRVGVVFFKVDSVSHKNCTDVFVTVHAPGWLFFEESRVDLEKLQPRKYDFT